MRIHWVELENWRQHVKTRIDFDDKASIIYGPNEKGKSTVFEALIRGFFDKTSSENRDIKHIKPNKSTGNITSSVKIEFTVDQTGFRIEKNFNLRKGTSLYRVGESIPIDQDRSADERILELLEADTPKGMSKPSQWGACQWLWATQNKRKLPEKRRDTDPDPTKSLHLQTEGVKGVIVTPKYQAVFDRVRSQYSNYFYQNGRINPKSPVKELEDQISNLQTSKEELESKIKKVDAERRSLEDLQQRLPELEIAKIKTEEEMEAAILETSDLSSIEAALSASEMAVREASRNVMDIEDALKSLEDSSKEIKDLQDEHKEANEEYYRLEALCQQLSKNLDDDFKEVEMRASKIRNAEELLRDVRILLTISDTMEKINELNKKIKRINEIERLLENFRNKTTHIFPENTEIEDLVENQAQVEILKKNLKERGLSVRITPGEKGSLNVELDGKKMSDKELSGIGTKMVLVDAQDLGSVSVKAKLEDTSDTKNEIESLENNINRTLLKYSSNSIDELRTLNRDQNEIQKNIGQLEAERIGIDERPTNNIILEFNQLEKKYKEYNEIERTPNSIKMNSIDMNLGKLVKKRENELEDAKEYLDEKRNERDETKDDLAENKNKLDTTEINKKRISSDLDDALNQQDGLISKYGSVNTQRELLVEAKKKLNDKKTEYEKLKQRHEELEKGPMNRIERLEKQLKHQKQIIREHRTSMDELKGGIKTSSLDGAYSKLSEIESKLEISSERLKNEQIQEKSLTLLKETLELQYFSVMSEVIGPIKEDVENSLNYVTGSFHNRVELNEYLLPTKINEGSFDEETSLDLVDGSAGLKEVLSLCVRLAIAKHLSEMDPQCIVLDDPFVHVSSDRLNRVIELMNEAMNNHKLQIIVFTHREMELSGLEGKMINIERVKAN